MEYYADSIFRNHHMHKASLFVSLKVAVPDVADIRKGSPTLENMLQN